MEERRYELIIERTLGNRVSQRETLMRFLIVTRGEIGEIVPLEVGKVVEDLKNLHVELKEVSQ